MGMNSKPIKVALLTSSNNKFIVNLIEQIAKIHGIVFTDIIYWDYQATNISKLKKNIKKHGLIYIPWRTYVYMCRFVKKIITDNLYKILLIDEIEDDLIERCRDLGISIHNIANIHTNEGIELVSSLECDILAVCGTGILRKQIFTLPKIKTINLHQGEVPKYRGAPPGFWELFNGEKQAGVTIHFIDEGVDTGDIILQQIVPIFEYDNLATVQDKLSEISIPLYIQAIKLIAAGDYKTISQAGMKGNQNFLPTLSQKFSLAIRISSKQFSFIKKSKAVIKTIVFPVISMLISLRDTYYIKVQKKKILSILYYHRVTDICQDGMTIANREFEKQIRFIKKHYDVISGSDINSWLAEKSVRKGVIITFDDGYEDNYTNAFPVLRKYSCPAVFFVSTGLIDNTLQFEHDREMQPDIEFRIMNWEQLKEVSEGAVEIGVHAHMHRNLNNIKYEDAVKEISLSIDTYKKIFDKQPHMMSYPFGGKDDISRQIIKFIKNETPIKMLFSAYGNKNITPFNFSDLKRVNIGSGDSNLLLFQYKLEGGVDALLHPFETYEFFSER